MNPIRKIKCSLIPPCDECANSGITSAIDFHFTCCSDKYIEHCKKTECVAYASTNAKFVRGTRFCKFKKAEDDE